MASPQEYLVGVYYFAGWWPQSPNKWTTAGRDWRPDYPGRIPILGQYNDQATMNREILAAAGHGVDFFQILLLIYAWNEFGEGGILAPTAGEKEMKLEVVREVFK